MSPFPLEGLPLTLLLLEEADDRAARVHRLFAEGPGTGAIIHRATDGVTGLAALAAERFDLVLLGAARPEAVATLARLREVHPEVPVVVLDGTADPELAPRCLALGAEEVIAADLLAGFLPGLARTTVLRTRLRSDATPVPGGAPGTAAGSEEGAAVVARPQESARVALEALSDLAVALATPATRTQVHALIAAKLVEVTHAFAVGVCSYDAGSSDLVVEQVVFGGDGGRGVLEAIHSMLGQSMVGFRTPISREVRAEILGQAVRTAEDLHEVTLGAVPRVVARALGALFGMGRFYGLAIASEAELLGTVIIVMPRGAEPFSEVMRNTLARICTVAVQRARAQDALATSERMLRRITESIPGVVFQFRVQPDGSAAFSYVSPRADDLFGFPLGLGQPGWSLGVNTPADERERFVASVRQAIACRGPWHHEGQLVSPTGAVRWYQGSAAPTVLGDALVYDGVLVDITERKRVQEALRRSEEEFRLVFHHVVDGLVLSEPQTGRIVLANEAMGRMLGYPPEELLGMGVLDLLSPEDRPARLPAFEREHRGRTRTDEGVSLRSKDGSRLVADVSTTQAFVAGRTLLLSVCRDVTEQRRIQARVAQSDRLAAMGLLAAGVAHEINNPLAYVSGNLQSLAADVARLAALRALPDAEALADLAPRLAEALEGTERIRSITKGLSTFARVEREEAGPVDLRPAIESALRIARNEIRFRARLVTELADVPRVIARAGDLSQVFLNLLVNAAHAIPEGDLEHHEVRLRTFTEGDRVVAEVSDTGTGIPPEHLERIFDPFFTTKLGGAGSGLGLSICRSIVTGFGGELTVESVVGRGSRFLVRLPLAPLPRPASVPAPASPRAPERVTRGRILVVDDEAPIRRILKRLIGAHHEVVFAASGDEARDLLLADAAFDLVLCDVMMPGISGPELHAWIAARDPVLAERVVFISGGAFTPGTQEYLDRVSNLRVDKPFDLAHVETVITRMIARARTEALPGEPGVTGGGDPRAGS